MRRLDTPYIRRRVAQRATVVKPHPAAEQVSPVGYHPGARFQAVSVYVLPYPTYGHSATLPIYPCHISLIYIRQGNGPVTISSCSLFWRHYKKKKSSKTATGNFPETNFGGRMYYRIYRLVIHASEIRKPQTIQQFSQNLRLQN